jgi:hypothetical protein
VLVLAFLHKFIPVKGQGQGGIHIDVTLDPDLTLTGDHLEVGPIHHNTRGEGAEVTLQCLTGGDIQGAGHIQIPTVVWGYLA